MVDPIRRSGRSRCRKASALLWQGAPRLASLAVHAFHVRKIALYFAALLLSGSGVRRWRTAQRWRGALRLGRMAPAGRRGRARRPRRFWPGCRRAPRSTRSPDRRVVMRIGIALPVTLNVPFRHGRGRERAPPRGRHRRHSARARRRAPRRLAAPVAACAAVARRAAAADAARVPDAPHVAEHPGARGRRQTDRRRARHAPRRPSRAASESARPPRLTSRHRGDSHDSPHMTHGATISASRRPCPARR